jgi:ketosteroid isomerase-like protein
MKNGGKYDQKFCWICRFDDNKIVEIGMYRDTAHIKETIEGNE